MREVGHQKHQVVPVPHTRVQLNHIVSPTIINVVHTKLNKNILTCMYTVAVLIR